jgi:hypothetical protein
VAAAGCLLHVRQETAGAAAAAAGIALLLLLLGLQLV